MMIVTTFPNGEQVIFESVGTRTRVLAHHIPDTDPGHQEQQPDTQHPL